MLLAQKREQETPGKGIDCPHYGKLPRSRSRSWSEDFCLSIFLVFFVWAFFPCFSYGFLNMPSGSACPPPLVGILFCVFCWFFW